MRIARFRAGASRKLEVLVQGWTQPNGQIWPLHGLVNITDKWIGITAKMLIAGVTYSLDDSGGELTTLQLVFPETFQLKRRAPVKKQEFKTAFDQNRAAKQDALKAQSDRRERWG